MQNEFSTKVNRFLHPEWLHPTILFVLKPVPEDSHSDLGRGLGSLGLAGSTKIAHTCKNVAFISSLAFSASSMDVYVTKPNPFDLPVTLSLMTLAARSFKIIYQDESRMKMYASEET